jgi:2-oxoglutarate dehydrogenase E1 component
MPPKTEPDLGINSWLEDELYQRYLNDRTAVDESWKHIFEDPITVKQQRPLPPGLPLRLPGTMPRRPTRPATSSPCAASPLRSPKT